MTTRLPSTGAPEPADAPAPSTTCRSDEVVVIHRLFRRLFADAPRIVRGVDPGDVRRASRIAKHLHGITALLHVHHRTEDFYFWDTMTERAPACGLHVALMRQQHATVSDLLDSTDVLVDEWAVHASAPARDRLAAELDEVDRLLLVHLADEERDAFPVLDRILSDAEWDGIHAAAKRHKPPLPIFVLIGLMLESVPPAERDAWFEHEMPAPIRLAYRAVGRRQYERAVRDLFGAGNGAASAPAAPGASGIRMPRSA